MYPFYLEPFNGKILFQLIMNNFNSIRYFSILFLLTFLFTGISSGVKGQCQANEVEVYIDVHTDDWAYEGYWELVPTGNACGTGTIFAGGNAVQVGCSGGGQQTASSGGYANNQVVTEGPWCLIQGNSYDIKYVDDWGDGGFEFSVSINGYPIYHFTGSGSGNTFTFQASPPLQYDAGLEHLHTFNYYELGAVDIEAEIFNFGGDTIQSLDVSYSINGNTPVTQSLSGLSIAPFSEYHFLHNTPWTPSSTGLYNLEVWTSNVNGNQDMDTDNDTLAKSVEIGDPVPSIIDDYLTTVPNPFVVGNSTHSLDYPRDLDFHPTLSRYELWVINTNTENSGGSTVTFDDAGMAGQTDLWRRDGNAWHFMSLPTGIAFGENENFATSPGVFDANHDGGAPFTGPTLWSSDPNIYAQPSGGNGSHLDMLHESPHAMGIAHETGNVYWVFDGYSNDIVRYDFVDDHGPGNSYHGDAIVRRYPELNVSRINGQIASHLVLDKETEMLYIVDGGNARVLRLDINSGTPGGTPTFSAPEPLAEYVNVTGTTWEVLIDSGLTQPCGIEVFEDRLLVSDHATGEIIIYDISGIGALEMGRIQTGFPGVQGIKVGPDGKIWYVNASRNEVLRMDQLPVGTDSELATKITIYPNPSDGEFFVNIPLDLGGNIEAKIFDLQGREVQRSMLEKGTHQMSLETIASGSYMLCFFRQGALIQTEKIIRR